jgi:hypothetical protein
MAQNRRSEFIRPRCGSETMMQTKCINGAPNQEVNPYPKPSRPGGRGSATNCEP